jgi:hypothetical protein
MFLFLRIFYDPFIVPVIRKLVLKWSKTWTQVNKSYWEVQKSVVKLYI